VHRFFRTKASVEIDDMVQQTFLGCLETRSRCRAESSFKTFLFAIARNQLFKHYRRMRDRADFSPSPRRDLATSPSGRAARRQDELLLAEALDRLPRGTRLILELAYWEELDGAAIAPVLEVPLNTAYSLLRRAKLSLRGWLEELAPDHLWHVAHALAALETQA
jgi:RNA polymerase sigma-70 factor (ECF subfamily)